MTTDNITSSEIESQGFSEHWLSLREPVDHAARDSHTTQMLADWAAQITSQTTSQTTREATSQTLTGRSALNILELGAGTGSNLRYLLPYLGHQQHWLLLDNDEALLRGLPGILRSWCELQGATLDQSDEKFTIRHTRYSATVSTRTIDLARQVDDIDFADTQLVTASALLDLTADTWLDALARKLVTHQCSCLFALNYSGAIQWQPELTTDQQITQLLNAHQLSDKGFGGALGPAAGNYFASKLEALGRDVHTATSQWDIAPHLMPLQHAIVDGWADAALEQNSSGADAISLWHTQRKQMIEQQLSSLKVSHVDVLSLT